MSSTTEVPLWPDGAPDGPAGAAGPPRLVRYRPDGPVTGAMVVCPGGAYTVLAEHEGHDVALWLGGLGIEAYVLHYRVAGPQAATAPLHPGPLADLRRAIRVARHLSGTAKVGAIGFSAGGHLVATAATGAHLSDDRGAAPADEADTLSCVPDAVVLGYPVIIMGGEGEHAWSRQQLLGPDAPADTVAALSPDRHVDASTPPAYLWHTADDDAVPAVNSERFARALGAAGVPYVLDVLPSGPHGLGLAPGHPCGVWPSRCASWLAEQGFARGEQGSVVREAAGEHA